MTRLPTFFLCLALVGCASSPAPPSGSMRNSFEPRLLIQHPVSQLALSNTVNRQWQIQAEVNGQSGLFAVDTGSETTIITPQFADKLGLLRDAVKGRFAGPNPLGQKVRYTKLVYFRLGGILYLDFYVPILNLDHINRAMHAQLDGILGNNLLSQTTCSIDWRKNLLTLDAQQSAPPANALLVSVRNHRIFVTAQVNGQPIEFVLDTGAYSSSLSQQTITALNLSNAKKTVTDLPRVDLAGSNSAPQMQIVLDTFSLGKITRSNFSMLIWDQNVLGMDVLDSWVLNFDARSNWMSLSEPEAVAKP